ncbi:MAG TPA: dihydrolipoamide acetyltransferase family protein [Methylomirabilota bacterium]|jgi:pyruvate dehydrogenase E2 component (dihydrolipoamide acetyltransferase)|nr:dihydrolipoamide acetyltransferase family protein [Methylomirabilota bacterium]
MLREFRLPDPGEGIHEAEILEVCVSAGDTVQEGDIILHIETDKAAVEVPSPFTGVVAEIKVRQGDIVNVGDVLMIFAVEEGRAERPETKPGPQALAEERDSPQPERDAAMRRGAPEVAEESLRLTVPASPATRQLAHELGVDLRQVPGSGPGRRVTPDDVRAFAARAQQEEQRRMKAAPPLPDFTRWGPVESIPLRGVRRATAKRTALAWSQIPHVMHQDVADITELEALRRRHAAAVERQGGKLSLTVLLMQAAATALKQFPRFNASINPETEEIIVKQYYHIGVAVDTEQGLLVPVVRDVDRKSLTELAVEVTETVARVRDGKATREDLQGGTFTITNLGAIGGTALMPIINYPEVAILGVARARLEPVVQGDLEHFTLVPRLRLPLHLAFDHRVNDGADAARFLRSLIALLGDPQSFHFSG